MKPAVRDHVLAAIRETCAYRGWGLHAVHVREEHVHVVVDAEVEPERVMTDLKAWATRRLQGVEPEVDRRWTRHGSTRWLRRPESIRAAVRYVADGQGEPMAVYVAPELWRRRCSEVTVVDVNRGGGGCMGRPLPDGRGFQWWRGSGVWGQASATSPWRAWGYGGEVSSFEIESVVPEMPLSIRGQNGTWFPAVRSAGPTCD